MYVIDINIIEEGDIILRRSNERESRLIRARSKSEYSHAILYVGRTCCIDSDGLGVRSRNVERILLEDEKDVLILRLKSYISAKDIKTITDFVRSKIGTEYSTVEAKLATTFKNLTAKEPNRQYCTRIVAQAYQQGGFIIVENPDYCTPQDILDSNKLIVVQNATKKATQGHIDFANTEDLTEIQLDIQNCIFEEVRNIDNDNNDIQTFEQLSNYVLDNKDKEVAVNIIIQKSGYLNFWDVEVKKNPWFYNSEEFALHYKDIEERIHIAYLLATLEDEDQERFRQIIAHLFEKYKKHEQEFFLDQMNLYITLIELSEKRCKIGLEILIKNNLI